MIDVSHYFDGSLRRHRRLLHPLNWRCSLSYCFDIDCGQVDGDGADDYFDGDDDDDDVVGKHETDRYDDFDGDDDDRMGLPFDQSCY